jgi:lysophospholipase L1-like esterase
VSASDEGAPPRRRRLILAVAVVLVIVAGAGAAVALARDDPGADDATPPAGPAGEAPAEPVDVAIVGDSLIEQSRDQFVAHADEEGLSVETAAFGGSAPCDWMEAFQGFADAPPAVLIISFAGNDSTPCINPGGGPPRDPQTIADAYAEDLPEILDLFAGTRTALYVVVPPPVGEPASEPAAVAIRSMYRELVADRPEVTLVDPAAALGPDGRFHPALPCEDWEADACSADGTVGLRRDDGIHLTPAGGERYARVLLDAIGHPVDG